MSPSPGRELGREGWASHSGPEPVTVRSRSPSHNKHWPKRQMTPLTMTSCARRPPQVSTAHWALRLARGTHVLLRMSPTPDSPAHPVSGLPCTYTCSKPFRPSCEPALPEAAPCPPPAAGSARLPTQCPSAHGCPPAAQQRAALTPCHVPEVPVPHRAQYSEWETGPASFPRSPSLGPRLAQSLVYLDNKMLAPSLKGQGASSRLRLWVRDPWAEETLFQSLEDESDPTMALRGAAAGCSPQGGPLWDHPSSKWPLQSYSPPGGSL